MNDVRPPLNHYDVLGVGHAAPWHEIRASYLRLVKIYHPDRATSPVRKAAALQMFQTITAAYATLSKPDSRRAYDLSLAGEEQIIAPGNDNGSRDKGGSWRRFFGSLV